MRCVTRLITIVDEVFCLSLLVVFMAIDTVIQKFSKWRSNYV